MVVLIADNDETWYRQDVQHLAGWCADNDLVLNTSKTKEVIFDFRRTKRTTQHPIYIRGEKVERVESVRFLGTYITKDLTWTLHTSNLVKMAQQRMFLLRKLRKAGLAPQLLNNFYRSTIESILSSCTAEYCGS